MLLFLGGGGGGGPSSSVSYVCSPAAREAPLVTVAEGLGVRLALLHWGWLAWLASSSSSPRPSSSSPPNLSVIWVSNDSLSSLLLGMDINNCFFEVFFVLLPFGFRGDFLVGFLGGIMDSACMWSAISLY